MLPGGIERKINELPLASASGLKYKHESKVNQKKISKRNSIIITAT